MEETNCRNSLCKERHTAQAKGVPGSCPWFVPGISSKTLGVVPSTQARSISHNNSAIRGYCILKRQSYCKQFFQNFTQSLKQAALCQLRIPWNSIVIHMIVEKCRIPY